MASFKILIFLLLQSSLLLMVVDCCRRCQLFSTVNQVHDCLEKQVQNKLLVLTFYDPHSEVEIVLDKPPFMSQFGNKVIFAAVNVRAENELQSIYRVQSEQVPFFLLIKRSFEDYGRVVKKTRINQKERLILLIMSYLFP